MTPGQLNKAANSLRPSSILDDEDMELGNGELERDSGEGEDAESEDDVVQEVESEQEMSRVNEEEVSLNTHVHEIVEERNGDRSIPGNQTSSDVELVIDYGGKQSHTLPPEISGAHRHRNTLYMYKVRHGLYNVTDEEMSSRSAALENLVHRKKSKVQRQHRHRPHTIKPGTYVHDTHN